MSLFLAVERFCSRRESSATVKTMLLLLLLTHSVLTAEQGPPPILLLLSIHGIQRPVFQEVVQFNSTCDATVEYLT